jgi:SAM-dependent methyltransferase
MERQTAELRFHDQQATERARTFQLGEADLRFDTDTYLDHESWIRYAFAALGDLRGRTALDYGCGHGMAAVVLARSGAKVTASDLSAGYIREARTRAEANGVRGEFVIADGEDLPFPNATFDVVWGNAILHHLNLMRAGQELKRVMKPDGVAVFCEPWGGNPVLEFARHFLPYPGKDRTVDEQPLTRRDLRPLRAIFPTVEIRGFQLFGMVRRVWKNPRGLRILDALDARILRRVPLLENWCRYVVIVLRPR